MAFKKVRLTHPKGKFDDVVATNAIDLNNFLYRDGYAVSEDQSGLDDEVPDSEKEAGPVDEVPEADEAAGAGSAAEAAEAAEPEPAAEPATRRSKKTDPPPVEKRTPETAKGTATNAEGETVPTA